MPGDTFFDECSNKLRIYDGEKWTSTSVQDDIASRTIFGNVWYKIITPTPAQSDWILTSVDEDKYFSDPGSNGIWITDDMYTMMILAGLT